MKTFTTKYGSILAGLLASKYGVNAMGMDEEDMITLFQKNNWQLPEEVAEDVPAPLEEKSEEELREMAKDAGIRGAHNMKKETLIKKLS